MSCRFCAYVGQYGLNWLNLLDHALNTLLLGDADETMSARVARARNAGQAWAGDFCKFFSFATKVITLGHIDRDHCTWALDPAFRPDSREIWNWSTMSLNPVPVSEVEVIDNGAPSDDEPD